MKRKIFILYPYYWPLYKAGGPIQSLFNLVATLGNYFDFYLISLNKDIDGQPANEALKIKEWNVGPNKENVYCTSWISPFLLFRKIQQVRPDVLLVNGIFHWHTTFFGLLIGRILGARIVISPRGMLQAWALERGKFKKQCFLSLLKLLIRKNDTWHATNEQEKEEIYKIFGADRQVQIAPNIPRALGKLSMISFPDEFGKIKLVFLSLINPNKNLHLIIEAVNKCGGVFTLDIYGPIIDANYWRQCQDRIQGDWVSYKGPITPWDVPNTLQNYHFFVLPTQGENFGHAIFDSLASGVPVVISRNTPWGQIDEKQAGIYLDSNGRNPLGEVLGMISVLHPDGYEQFRRGAHQYAKHYLDTRDYLREYQFLLHDN